MKHAADIVPSFVDKSTRRTAFGASATVRHFLLTGREEHHIALSDAIRLTANVRSVTGPDAVRSFFYGRRALDRILAQSSCVGIRAYYGLQPDGSPTFVLTGVTPDGADIVDGVLTQDAASSSVRTGIGTTRNADDAGRQSGSGGHPKFLTGDEIRGVTLAEAVLVTRSFRSTQAPGSVKAHYFGRLIAEEILGQQGCIGLRLVRAQEDSGRRTLVLVGIDGWGDDIVPGILGEHVLDCPPWCSVANPLNR